MDEGRREFGLRRSENARPVEPAAEATNFAKDESMYRRLCKADEQMRKLFEVYDSIVSGQGSTDRIHSDSRSLETIEAQIRARYEALNART